ncbi:MAG: hypothetical protein AAB329_06265, partial [Pseudomonadota bacterium]
MAIVGLSLMAGSALAKDFKSAFGYSATVPDHWRIMTRDDVQANSGQISSDAKRELKDFNPQTV